MTDEHGREPINEQKRKIWGKFYTVTNEHKRAKRWTALLFSSSKPKPSELQLRKGALLRRTPRPSLAQAPLPLPISLASRISATAPFFKNPLAGPLV